MSTLVQEHNVKRYTGHSHWLGAIWIATAGKPYFWESEEETHKYQIHIAKGCDQAIQTMVAWFDATYTTPDSQRHRIDVFANGVIMLFSRKADLALALLSLEDHPVRGRWRPLQSA